jgi:hypothetical protein
MSTPVRGGADGPLGYAPPRARQAGTARANTALDGNALPELTDKPPRIVASLRDEPDSAPREQDPVSPRAGASLREALSSRDSLAPRESSSSLRDALSSRDSDDPLAALSRDPLAALAPRDPLAPRENSLRDALSSRDGLSRAPLAPRETSLRDALSPRDGSPRDRLAGRDPLSRDAAALRPAVPQHEGLAARDPLSRDGGPLRTPAPPREGLAARDPLLRDAGPLRAPAPPRDGLAARGPLSRDAGPLRPPAAPRDGLAARDPLSRDAASLRAPALPRDGITARDPLLRDPAPPRAPVLPRDGLAAGRDAAAPQRDAFSLLDPQPFQDMGRRDAGLQGTRSGEVIPKSGPRTLLDEAADFGLAPAKENIARWEASPPPSRAPEATPWKRKKRTPEAVFEGDAAMRELRTRLAAAPSDQTPEPPLVPAKTPIIVSAVRLTGVVGLAAVGALGFLWITSPQGPRTASPQVAAAGEEVTRVSFLDTPASTTHRAAAATPAVPVERPPAPPSSSADAPYTVANLTGDAADKTVEPAVLPQPRMAGPPPARSRSVVLPSQPAPAPVVVAPPPPVQPVAIAPAAPPPVVAPAAPVSVAAVPAAMPAPTPAVVAAVQLGPDEINAMLVRARTFLSSGDVAAARVVLRRAAASDDAQATLALAGTYDPSVLKKLGILSFQADPNQARQWYSKAKQLGSTEASARLEQMAH